MKPRDKRPAGVRDLHHKLNHHRKAGAHGRGRRDPQGKREAVEEHLEGENEETLTAGPTERDSLIEPRKSGRNRGRKRSCE